LTTFASTLVACLIGAAQVVGWPLTEGNLSFSLYVGGFLGLLGSVVVGVITLSFDAKVRLAVIGISATSIAIVCGFAFYFWCATIASA